MDIKAMIAQAAAPHMQSVNEALTALETAIANAAAAGFVVEISQAGASADSTDPYVISTLAAVRDAFRAGGFTAEMKYSATVREAQ
jgi:hypothetical protein